MNEIAKKQMAVIAQTFQEARRFAETEEDMGAIRSYLQKMEPDFRPVAYEGVSMAISVDALMRNGKIDSWFESFNQLDPLFFDHAVIGLGWALSRVEGITPEMFSNIKTEQVWRVFDGLGYHDGIFRRKKVLTGPLLSDELKSGYGSAYDQGIGRQLWYAGQSDISVTLEYLNEFAAERKSDLWRGVGVAATFVGGLEYQDWIELLRAASRFSLDVKCGIVMVANARSANGTLNEYTISAVRCVLGSDVKKASDIVGLCKSVQTTIPECYFTEYISNLKEKLGSG